MGSDVKLQKTSNFFQKTLDNVPVSRYNGKAVKRFAAIAQPVERILGKDEVASSNLASSSIKTPKPFGFGVFYLRRQI